MKPVFMLAVNNLLHRKKRAWLTMIGIFIGIAAVVSLISLGQGLEGAINLQFQRIGSDKLFIQSDANLFGASGGDISNPLTTKDMNTVAGVQGVAEVSSYVLRVVRVQVGQDVGYYYAAGFPTSQGYQLARDSIPVDLYDGRELRPGDTNKVLVGYDYTRTSSFQNPVGVGDRITVNGQKFTVVGVMEPVGDAPDDHAVYMPIDTLKQLTNVTDQRDAIIARVAPGEDPNQVAADITRELDRERHLRAGEEDFNVQTPEDLLASFGTIITLVQVVLVGIAGISLLVGGIGIMNTMYTAVLERTRDIGIMKAIGASPGDIRSIFLLESGLLGLVGGMIGVAIGVAIAKAVQYIGTAVLHSAFLTAELPWWLIVGALVFSTVIGMVSGYLPARSASRQNPVESLRYE